MKIERVQKSFLKILIQGQYSSYTETCEQFRIQKLFERREKLCLRFGKKELAKSNSLFQKCFKKTRGMQGKMWSWCQHLGQWDILWAAYLISHNWSISIMPTYDSFSNDSVNFYFRSTYPLSEYTLRSVMIWLTWRKKYCMTS